METLKQTALLMLFCSAAAMIVWFLLPSGKISQTAKSAVSVVLLLVTLSPLFSLSFPETPRLFTDAEAPAEGYQELFLSAVRYTLRNKIDEVVKNYTDMPYEIVAGIHIGEDNSITIEQVRIIFEFVPENAGALADALTLTLGFEPVMVYREVA